MKRTVRIGASILAVALIACTPVAALAQEVEKPGSLHVQCDGYPNNVTAGETAARLIGAVTLLGLFAPPPEAADATKRKFGSDGVAVCTTLIDGEKPETNVQRRIGLILARAVHHIEAKEYAAAIADTELGRREAEAAGLMADPYYARSQGRSFDAIAAAALFREGRRAEARDAALRSVKDQQYSYYQLISLPKYLVSERSPSPDVEAYDSWFAHLNAASVQGQADRFDQWGRFAESAKIRDALIDFSSKAWPESIDSGQIARAAIAHALAGDAEVAAKLAADARANFTRRTNEGKPDANASAVVELLDLYSIIETAQKGELPAARRLFAARSAWVAPSFGTVAKVNTLLRAGASAEEMIGGMAKDSETLWKEREDAQLAEALAKDSDNKTLFWLIERPESANEYYAASKNVWRTDKSKMVLKLNSKVKEKIPFELLWSTGNGVNVGFPAIALHAALLAKSRGQQGFVMVPIIGTSTYSVGVFTGNPGDPGLPAAMFNDAEAVIAALSPVIPSPEQVKLIKAKAKK